MALTKVHDRMIANSPIDVMDYGADNTGATDSLAAIQLAVDAMSNGSTIVFPEGNYSISDQVIFDTSNITVIGRKAKITQTGSNKRSFYFDTLTYIEVYGFNMYGKGSSDFDGSNTSAGVNGAAFWFDTCSGLDVHDNYIQNHAGGHIRMRYNCSNSRVTNNRVVGIGTAGGIVSGDNDVDVGVDFREAGVGLLQNVVISGNDISDTCFGIFVSEADGVVISSNTVRSIRGQHGIYNSTCSNMVISGNTFENIALLGIKAQQLKSSGGIFYNYSVTGNVINNAQSGIVFEDASGLAVGTTYTEGVSITGNTITNLTTNYGMSLDGVKQLNVVGNVIDRCGAQGIYIRNCGLTTVSSNQIYNAGANGIWAFDLIDDIVISNNLIKDAVQNYDAATSTDGSHYYYVFVDVDAAATKVPLCFFQDNTLIIEAATPTLFASNGKCFRALVGVNVYWMNNTNLTTKAWQIDATDLKHMDIGHSPNVDFTSGGSASPTTPIYGRGHRNVYGTQDPASASMTDTFDRGDICWNATPSASGTIGWSCVTSGTPGTWKSFGVISA